MSVWVDTTNPFAQTCMLVYVKELTISSTFFASVVVEAFYAFLLADGLGYLKGFAIKGLNISLFCSGATARTSNADCGTVVLRGIERLKYFLLPIFRISPAPQHVLSVQQCE